MSSWTGTRLARSALFFLGVIAGVTDCQIFVPNDAQQCGTDSDCQGRGPAFLGTTCVSAICVKPQTDAGPVEAGGIDAAPIDPKWGCLGSVKYNPPSPTERVNLRQRFVHLLNSDPIAGLRVKACNRLDIACPAPLDTQTSDADGVATLRVPRYFDGFLEITQSPSFPDMISTILTVGAPSADSPPGPVAQGTWVHLTSAGELNFLLAQIGATLDPMLGSMLGLAVDCTGAPAAGVSVKASIITPKTVSYYVDGLPSTTAQETSATAEAGFVNLPTGPVTITSTLVGAGKKVGSTTILIRAGWLTYLAFGPTP